MNLHPQLTLNAQKTGRWPLTAQARGKGGEHVGTTTKATDCVLSGISRSALVPRIVVLRLHHVHVENQHGSLPPQHTPLALLDGGPVAVGGGGGGKRVQATDEPIQKHLTPGY